MRKSLMESNNKKTFKINKYRIMINNKRKMIMMMNFVGLKRLSHQHKRKKVNKYIFINFLNLEVQIH